MNIKIINRVTLLTLLLGGTSVYGQHFLYEMSLCSSNGGCCFVEYTKRDGEIPAVLELKVIDGFGRPMNRTVYRIADDDTTCYQTNQDGCVYIKRDSVMNAKSLNIQIPLIESMFSSWEKCIYFGEMIEKLVPVRVTIVLGFQSDSIITIKSKRKLTNRDFYVLEKAFSCADFSNEIFNEIEFEETIYI